MTINLEQQIEQLRHICPPKTPMNDLRGLTNIIETLVFPNQNQQEGLKELNNILYYNEKASYDEKGIPKEAEDYLNLAVSILSESYSIATTKALFLFAKYVEYSEPCEDPVPHMQHHPTTPSTAAYDELCRRVITPEYANDFHPDTVLQDLDFIEVIELLHTGEGHNRCWYITNDDVQQKLRDVGLTINKLYKAEVQLKKQSAPERQK